MAISQQSVPVSNESPASIEHQPLVSVVIPTYNRAQPTMTAITSVLEQTYRNLEVLVIDDGSTNGAGDIVREFVEAKAASGHEVYYFRQANQGPSQARNVGIEKARGEYVAFLDSDDVWLPEKLAAQLRALQQFRSESAACFTDAFYVTDASEQGSTLQLYGIRYDEAAGIERRATMLLAKSFCGFWVSTLLARTDLLRRIGGFDTGIGFSEERDLYFRLSLITCFTYVKESLARCDRNGSPPGSDCRPWDKAEVRLGGHQRMYEKWLASGASFPADVRKVVLERLRSTHCSWANLYLENRSFPQAQSAMSKAVSYGATARVAFKWALIWLAPALTRKLSGKPVPYL
jgi:glycosyltransferase involved in cell wall biosynthesis